MLLLATMFIGFNACNDDDKSGSQDGKKLSKVVWYYSDNSVDMIFTFRYANGKLNKAMIGNDASTITYSGKNVIIVGGINQTLQLNNDGFAESGTLTNVNRDWSYRFTCEYSNGYLTKVNYPDSEYNLRIEIEYDNNGNISTAYEYSDYGVTEFKFTPSSYPAKGKNIFLLGQLFSDDYTLDLFWSAFYAGFLGKDSPNLVSSIECIEGNYTSNIKFDYTFDDSGYVKTMKKTEGGETNRISFTYE